MPRVDLDALPYSTVEKIRLHRILFENGPGNGLAMILPIDHGLEHGPVDFFANPDAIGSTLYVGSPSQGDDLRQFQSVRREADRCGMPILVWAYPRGKAIEEKGGRDSPYAIAKVVSAAAGIPVLIAGGGKMSDEALLDRARVSIEAGASGLIFRRNMFQRPLGQRINISHRIREMMRRLP